MRAGKANASSGRIFVTVPLDHFGPIPASADPTRNRGVLVGDSWADRLECRQWGAHFPHVAGIAGQSSQGAQSVALSGGCVCHASGGEPAADARRAGTRTTKTTASGSCTPAAAAAT